MKSLKNLQATWFPIYLRTCVIVDYDDQVRSGVLTEPQIRSLYVLEKEGLIKINLSDLKGRYLL